MSMNWTFIPIEQLSQLEYQTALAAYKCQECGKFGHIELDCPQAVTLQAVLRKRAEVSARAIRAEERRRVAGWIGGILLSVLLIAGLVIWRAR